jgi:hypothetical protein
MAGLLDIFGTSGQETMGLLGMSPEDITRSRDEAQAQALYALAGRLFQGGRGASSVLEGLQQGQQAYKTAMQGGLQEQLQKTQLQEAIKKRQQEQQALMRQQAVQSEIEKAYRPETFAETPLTNLIGQEIAGPNVPQAAGIGMEALAPKLMATKEGRAALKDLQPEYKEVNGVLYEITAGMPPKLVAGTKKRDTVTVGNVVLDKDNMSVLYTAPEASAASIKEFEQFNKLTPAEKIEFLKLKKSGAGGDIINYPAGAVPLGKEGQNAIDKAALTTGERLSRLNTIETSYDPKFLEAKFRSVQDFRAIGEKFGLTKLTPEQKLDLERYSKFTQDSIRELNDYIVQVTGAAIGSAQEENRIKKGMPNIGTGLLDGDSPTQFAAKLSNTLRDLRTMEARLQYIKSNGLKIVDVPLDRMPEIMRQREQALITSLGLDVKNPQDRAVLKSRLATEFGLMR